MKKLLNISMIYAISAMIGGVFYREFTKFQDFTGVTVLGKIHTHLFAMGMLLFLIIALFYEKYPLKNNKKFRTFMTLYNIGLPLTVILMILRGIDEVKGLVLSKALNASISGVAGIGHALTGIGIIFLLLSLKEVAKEK